MPTAARIVANEFFQLGADEGRHFTPLELLKLVYIANGYHLGYNGQPLVLEEVEAWQYGPVIPDLYRAMKHYGASFVSEPVSVPFYLNTGDPLDDDGLSIIRWVYNEYKKFNGIELSSKTHSPGTPWSITWNERGKGALISPDLIANHYREKISEFEASAETRT
jgi:uncharacterized phage-associated protein